MKISKNIHYTNAGPTLCKVQLLADNLSGESALLVVGDDKKITHYTKIFQEQKIKTDILKDFSQLVDFLYNKTGFFITEQYFFQTQLKDFDVLLDKHASKLVRGETVSRDGLLKTLHEYGYEFDEYGEENCFFMKGDILSIQKSKSIDAIQVSFWGDQIEEIKLGSKEINQYFIGKIIPLEHKETDTLNTNLKSEIIKQGGCVVFDELEFYKDYEELVEDFAGFYSFVNFKQKNNCKNLDIQELFIENLDDFKHLVEKSQNKEIVLYTKNIQTIENFLNYNRLTISHLHKTGLNNLKSYQSDSSVVICDDNISRIFIKKRAKRSAAKSMDLLLQIKQGDYIVHADHGIGIFQEILEKQLPSTKSKIIKKEYVELLYANNDKLFVPITEISKISKYVGTENPKLTGLGGVSWEKKLSKASKEVEEIAQDLLEIYAKRKLEKGHAFLPMRTQEGVFSKSFDYTYTHDQLQIINEIFADMESEQPMDRLVCGDVGFGKTEIAFNALYKSIINGKQAAFISPLVVLAYEHFEKAKQRFKDFPINIEIVTRFESAKTVKHTLEKLKTGKIDMIIGTHRLLSEDVEFKDLGLLVVDEEHKFGVKDKEKIKSIKGNIDVLSLSATPIPRSLNLALNGIKSMSMLTTPPTGRQSIETLVSRFDEQLIYEAGQREFARDGQLFFIHNRVQTIETMKNNLQKIFPKKKIIIAHGQLPGDQLEDRILAFKRKQYDILLATTVIENGIDFSNVNTIFINDSYNFGISQIHQLRGRVGRSDKKGYCYLLYNKDKIAVDASKRLKTVVDYSHLGAGFELAVKDLEVRGGGDILGIKQSGQSKEIGVNLFLQMLEHKIEELKRDIDKSPTEVKTPLREASIDLNISALLDDKFFGSQLDKMNFYREIESLNSLEDLENIIEGFQSISNQEFSQEALNFFNLLRIKIIAADYNIRSIKKVGINYQIDFYPDNTVEQLKRFLDLDTQRSCVVINLSRIRIETKLYPELEDLVSYLLEMLSGKKKSKKIKLKKKSLPV